MFKDGRANPIVCGRKFCARCGRWRGVCDFGRQPGNTLTGLRSYCHGCERAVRRAWWQNASDEQRQRVVEYRRFWREAQGMKPRRRRDSVIENREAIYLPAPPLVAELRQWDGGWEALARRAGVPPRTINRLVHGHHHRVQIDVADKLAVALGVPSAVIWGERW
jgi:transcriptional regulator with XRE-family HTH domain